MHPKNKNGFSIAVSVPGAGEERMVPLEPHASVADLLSLAGFTPASEFDVFQPRRKALLGSHEQLQPSVKSGEVLEVTPRADVAFGPLVALAAVAAGGAISVIGGAAALGAMSIANSASRSAQASARSSSLARGGSGSSSGSSGGGGHGGSHGGYDGGSVEPSFSDSSEAEWLDSQGWEQE